jgi:hypothetical protein
MIDGETLGGGEGESYYERLKSAVAGREELREGDERLV